jgi:hypothetical protein
VIDSYYLPAIEAGVSVQDFWNLSLAELYDTVNTYSKRREKEFKNSIRMQFLHAELVSRYLALGKNDPVPQPWDYYPSLFAEEKKNYDLAASKEEMEQFKDRRRQFANAFNKVRRG